MKISGVSGDSQKKGGLSVGQKVRNRPANSKRNGEEKRNRVNSETERGKRGSFTHKKTTTKTHKKRENDGGFTKTGMVERKKERQGR